MAGYQMVCPIYGIRRETIESPELSLVSFSRRQSLTPRSSSRSDCESLWKILWKLSRQNADTGKSRKQSASVAIYERGKFQEIPMLKSPNLEEQKYLNIRVLMSETFYLYLRVKNKRKKK